MMFVWLLCAEGKQLITNWHTPALLAYHIWYTHHQQVDYVLSLTTDYTL